MKWLRLFSASLISFAFTTVAHAELGVGVFGSYHLTDNYTFSGPAADKISAKGSSSVGALLFLPVLPYFSLRAGLAYENLKFESKYTGGASSVTTTLENRLIPVNLHFEFPITGLYAFGGVIFVDNQKTTPGTSKAGGDTRTNLGLGYDFFSFTLLSLSAELEYMRGSKNLSPDPAYTVKANNLNLNLMARFTL